MLITLKLEQLEQNLDSPNLFLPIDLFTSHQPYRPFVIVDHSSNLLALSTLCRRRPFVCFVFTIDLLSSDLLSVDLSPVDVLPPHHSCLSIHLSVPLSFSPNICLSICPHVCLSIHLSVHEPIQALSIQLHTHSSECQ